MKREKISIDDIEFRSIKPSELEQITKVFNIAFKANRTVQDFINRIENQENPTYERQFVAVHNDKIVAGIRADYKPLYFHDPNTGKLKKYPCGEINDVSTLSTYRRLGIARKLMEMATKYMQNQSWDLAALQADPSYHARFLYESFGFEVLKSTGDIWTFAFGSIKAQLYYFKGLSLIIPVILPFKKFIAPQPPKYCINLVNEKNFNKSYHSRSMPNNKLKIIHVSGEIGEEDTWIDSWQNMAIKSFTNVQGLFDDYINDVIKIKSVQSKDSGALKEKAEKNPVLRNYMEKFSGRERGFFLACIDQDNSNRIQVREIQSNMIPDINLIGGLTYIIKNIDRGPIHITIPFADGIWIKKEFQNQGVATRLLKIFKKQVGKFFPVLICRTGSGNIPLRRALKRAGFIEIGGGITMIKPIKNQDLFSSLKEKIEPWILTGL
ncbi:MAG: GNAT family N-acetyltransferase [Promethearchaeota archaeon]